MPGRFDEFALRNYVQPMENEFMERGYLLPNGCKDLIDAMKAAEASFEGQAIRSFFEKPQGAGFDVQAKDSVTGAACFSTTGYWRTCHC